ncbi:MAG: hypothetical protein ACXWXZ_20570 [Candidatus Binatia bacterium]
MNPLLSRTVKYVAALIIFTLTATYFYFRFIGWSHPSAKLIGAYRYHVVTLGDYVRYKRDPNRFNNDSSAALSFDCERIRDDFVKLTQSIISPELSTSTETIVSREGSTLHLGDPSVSGSEAFAAWKSQVINLATIQHPNEAGHYGTVLQALFTSIRLHGRNADEEFSVDTKRGSKFDACG